jgi:hypothetical protein
MALSHFRVPAFKSFLTTKPVKAPSKKATKAYFLSSVFVAAAGLAAGFGLVASFFAGAAAGLAWPAFLTVVAGAALVVFASVLGFCAVV